MPINKNAFIRYQTLDKCFRNFSKRFYFEDLITAVNHALFDASPETSGVQVRQLRDDIRFMKSEAGYDAPIDAIRDGKKAYYRYENKDFTINKSPLKDNELDQLKSALYLLQRFEGAPQFEWLNQIGVMLEDRFDMIKGKQPVVGFDSNIDYSGYEHISTIFNAITNEQALEIEYKPFEKNALTFLFHPHYLKQYNNRWFVFGRNEEFETDTWNVPLDRIMSIAEVNTPFVDSKIDWVEFFEDFIGVTKPQNGVIEKVKLLFDKSQLPYIITKPLHLTQKVKEENGDFYITIEVMINYELERLLLSFGSSLKIIEPIDLSIRIQEELNKSIGNYK